MFFNTDKQDPFYKFISRAFFFFPYNQIPPPKTF